MTTQSDFLGGETAHAEPSRRLQVASRWLSRHLIRSLKLAIGLGLCGYALWTVLRVYVLSLSTEAVVAGKLTQVRAPIAGVVSFKGEQVGLGSLVESNAKLVDIDNPWLDDEHVRELENQLSLVEAEAAVIEPKAAQLEKFSEQLKKGADSYQQRRVRQLRALQAEAEAESQLADVDLKFARVEEQRQSSLEQAGVGSGESLLRVQRAAQVAEQRALAARSKVDSVVSQLEAALRGVNVDPAGMGSDKPYSRQRLDEVDLEIMRVWHQKSAVQTRLEALRQRLADAKARYRERSHAELPAPRRGRVWHHFLASKAYVNEGEPILSLLDCDSILVVATVSKRVFNRVGIGTSARFELDGTDARFEGRVVQVLGRSNPWADNLLVAPGLKTPDNTTEPYQVVVEVPELRQRSRGECTVGRTGEVKFDL